MPRKRTASAIYKSEHSEEQKLADKAKTQRLVERRYRRKCYYISNRVRHKNPEKDAERMAKKRKEMTEDKRLLEQESKRKYNVTYYQKHREDILVKHQHKHTSMANKHSGFIILPERLLFILVNLVICIEYFPNVIVQKFILLYYSVLYMKHISTYFNVRL
ncbi:hypothetical protein F5050DRAFT_1716497 [Lentinula boryana]|uniref:Uncharacterized protein n=1 Tax=Lentinula boryana TaxID=40481 RepID=A0ABQ8PXE9_9AGAR|nr:hypothetical protein F5050DRAFT_1716497 [Lentinula boryana]